MKSKLILTVAMASILLGFSGSGVADVDINIGINVPLLIFSTPPEVVVIPGTYVYFCPDVQEDLFFYQGYWYRSHRGNWYRSSDYAGRWGQILSADVPGVFFHLPRDFRTLSGYTRIPYGEFRRNWRAWDRDRHWDKVHWGRHDFDREREREHGLAPSFGEERRHESDRDDRRERHDSDRHRGREREREH